jgi:selT/selW/selH-like putative selenoprotein
VIAVLEMVPSSGGRFEVSLDDELLFSKVAAGRHANPGEVVELFRSRLGPELLF